MHLPSAFYLFSEQPYFQRLFCNCMLCICNTSVSPLQLFSMVGKMMTFDLWPIPLGGGAWGVGTNMWHPETPASYESLPAPLATQIPTLCILTSGGRGRGGGGSDIRSMSSIGPICKCGCPPLAVMHLQLFGSAWSAPVLPVQLLCAYRY